MVGQILFCDLSPTQSFLALISGSLIRRTLPCAIKHLLQGGLHGFATARLIANVDVFDDVAKAKDHRVGDARHLKRRSDG